MMKQYTLEIWVGLFVTAGIAALFMLAMQVSNLSAISKGDIYQVTAQFDNIGGLTVRSPVKASGVLVGRVTNITYDNNDYTAEVTLGIQRRFDKFPVDTRASIYTAGLLGEQYIELQPGFQENYLANGDRIMIAEPAIILEELIGRIIAEKIME